MKKTAYLTCFFSAFFAMNYLASKIIVSGYPTVKEINFRLADVIDSLQIMFVSKDMVYDSLFIDALKKDGYKITISYPFPLAGNQLMIDSLNKADLVIVGRSSVSSDLASSKDAWNKLINVPLMLMSQHSTARDKLNWFNSTSMIHIKDTVTINAYTSFPADTIFSGVTFISGDTLEWARSPEDITVLDSTTNGTVMVRTDYLKNGICVVRFESGQPFYNSVCDKPFGPRTYFGTGINTTGAYKPYTLTDESGKVWLAEVRRLATMQYTPYTGSRDTTLTGITLSTGVLIPAFSTDSFTYNVSLSSGTTSVKIDAVTANPCAKVSGTGTINISSGSGKAELIVTAENSVTVSDKYTVNFNVIPVGIVEKENDKTIIRNNPGEESIEIQLDDSFLGSRIRIINLTGQIILETTAKKNTEVLYIHDLKKGIYIIEIGNSGKFIARKFTVY